MPRYHTLDSAIVLCSWDPSIKAENVQNPIKSSSTVPTAVQLGALRAKATRLHTYGPAAGYTAEEIREEYFEGQEGVDFIGSCMPFFLVHAGADLFPPPRTAIDAQLICQRTPGVTKDQVEPRSIASNGSLSVDTPTKGSETESVLSSISSARFASLAEFDLGHGGKDEKSQQSTDEVPTNDILCSDATATPPKPIAKPIMLIIDLSHKSFMPSIWTGTRQDLCVTVFYNGELAQSRIIKATSILAPTSSKAGVECYSGRRVDTNLEIPWIIHPHLEGSTNSDSSSFETRWNEINRLLLAEAEEWGMYGNHRSVVGEYLKELANKPAPMKAGLLQHGRGATAGIIDVVITLGRSVSINAAGLKEPRRKLHQDFTGKERRFVIAPEEMRPKLAMRSMSHEATSKHASDRLVPDRLSLVMGKKNDNHHIDQIAQSAKHRPITRASSVLLADKLQPGTNIETLAHEEGTHGMEHRKRHLGSLPPPLDRTDISSSSPLFHSREALQIKKNPTLPEIPYREHPKLPKNIPQKTFRGPEPQTPERIVESPVSSYSLRSRSILHSNAATLPALESGLSQDPSDITKHSTQRMAQGQSFKSSSAKIDIQPKLLANNKHSTGSLPQAKAVLKRQTMPNFQVIIPPYKGLRGSRKKDPLIQNLGHTSAAKSGSTEAVAGSSQSTIPDVLTEALDGLLSNDQSVLTGSKDRQGISNKPRRRSSFGLNGSKDSPGACRSESMRVVFKTKTRSSSTILTRPNLLHKKDADKPYDNTEALDATNITITSKVESSGFSESKQDNSATHEEPEDKIPLGSTRRQLRIKTTPKPAASVSGSRKKLKTKGVQAENSTSVSGKNIVLLASAKAINENTTSTVEKLSAGKTVPESAPSKEMGKLKRTRSRNNPEPTASGALPEQPLAKKPRPANGSMTSPEMGDLFVAHKPSRGVDENLGASTTKNPRSSRIANNNSSGSALGVRSNRKIEPKLNASVSLTVNEKGTTSETAHQGTGIEESVVDRSVVSQTQISHKTRATADRQAVKPAETAGFPLPDPAAIIHRSRSYSQTSRGLTKPKPRMNLSHGDAAGVGQRITSLSATSNSAAPTLQTPVQEQGLGPTPLKDSSVSPGDTITVDTPSPAVEKNARNKRQAGLSLVSQAVTPNVASAETWIPNSICQNSVLTYATRADWSDVGIDKKGRVVRAIKAEREGIFRATGVLMGVRFVVGV